MVMRSHVLLHNINIVDVYQQRRKYFWYVRCVIQKLSNCKNVWIRIVPDGGQLGTYVEFHRLFLSGIEVDMISIKPESANLTEVYGPRINNAFVWLKFYGSNSSTENPVLHSNVSLPEFGLDAKLSLPVYFVPGLV